MSDSNQPWPYNSVVRFKKKKSKDDVFSTDLKEPTCSAYFRFSAGLFQRWGETVWIFRSFICLSENQWSYLRTVVMRTMSQGCITSYHKQLTEVMFIWLTGAVLGVFHPPGAILEHNQVILLPSVVIEMLYIYIKHDKKKFDFVI